MKQFDYHLDLFAGIGGFALATQMANLTFKQRFNSDINEFTNNVYKKNFPKSVSLGDVRKIEPETLPKGEYLITAGFPCQPFSIAGKQLGNRDERNLWGEVVRLVSALKPSWVVCENVPNLENVPFRISKPEMGSIEYQKGVEEIQTLQLYKCCEDLKAEGYEVTVFEIPAIAKNAPHKRSRLWIVAHFNDKGLQRKSQSGVGGMDREFTKRNSATVNGSTTTLTNSISDSSNSASVRHRRRKRQQNESEKRTFPKAKQEGRKLRRKAPRCYFGFTDTAWQRKRNTKQNSQRRKSKLARNAFNFADTSSTGLSFSRQAGIGQLSANKTKRLDNRFKLSHRHFANRNSQGQLQPQRMFRNVGRWTRNGSTDVANYHIKRVERHRRKHRLQQNTKEVKTFGGNWHEWLEVATAFCRVDDGLCSGLDITRLRNDIAKLYPKAPEKDIERAINLTISEYRRKRIESLGNSIVPQVAMEIFRVIGEI